MDRYQLFIDDYLETSAVSFKNEWKFNFKNLILGAAHPGDKASYFIGCMRNLAIPFRCVDIFTKVC